MRPVKTAIRILLLVLTGLLFIFIILAIFPPLVSINRISIEGAQRIPRPKILAFLEKTKFMGMIPTSNSIFDNAVDELGPLLDNITIKRHFFFAATVDVVEETDTYTLTFNAGKVAVDIEGHIVDSVTPSESSPVIMEVAIRTPKGFETLIPGFYNDMMAKTVSGYLKFKERIGLTFTKLVRNSTGYYIFNSSRGTVLLAPMNFKDASVKGLLPEKYKRIYLNDMNGLFAETSQGVLVVFGPEDEFSQTRYGALINFMETSKLSKTPLPAVIKLDIPYQVTACAF